MAIETSTCEQVSGTATNGHSAGPWPVVLTKGGATVRIFRCALQNGYVFFQVAYYRDGKRVREAITDEAEARQRARDVLKSLAKGEVEATSMKLQDARAYESALRLLEPAKVTLETACREYSEARPLLGSTSLLDACREYSEARALLGSTSLLDAVRDYAERKTQVVADKTVKEVVDEFLAAKEAGLPTKLGGVGGRVGDKYRYQTSLRLRKFETAVPGMISRWILMR